jgi:hypothetical protein
LNDIATRTRRKWGEARVVNQWLPQRTVDLRGLSFDTGLNPQRSLADTAPIKSVAQNHQSRAIVDSASRILLTVQRGSRSVAAGRAVEFAMIETVTAFLGVISASIFLAHAFDGFRSRA